MLTTPVKKYVLGKLAGDLTASGAYLTTGAKLGLSSTQPNVSGGQASACNFTEPAAADGYARISISGSGSVVYPFEWVSGSDYTQVQNKYEIHFNVATANWGTLSYVGIFDSTGNLLAFGPIVDAQGDPTTITVNSGHIPTIAVGQAKISLDVQ